MGPVESLEDCLFVGLMVSILQLVVPKVGPEAHPDRARVTKPAAPKISLGGTPYVHLAVIVSTTPTSNLMPSPYGVLVSPDGSIGPNFKPRPHLTHSQRALRCLLMFRSGHPGGWALSCEMLSCPRVLESLEGPPRGELQYLSQPVSPGVPGVLGGPSPGEATGPKPTREPWSPWRALPGGNYRT